MSTNINFNNSLGISKGCNITLASNPITPLLLDSYPNASVAYSLRKLRTAYSGNCIRVRRSSDNAEQDFGFIGNELDTASLLTFCGVGNGFVTTWYDQSGNGNNATQGALTSQPRIVENGIITTDITTGKPSVRFLNAGLNLSSSVQLTPNFISFFVIQRVPAVTLYTFGTTASTLYMMGIGSTGNIVTNIGGGAATNLQNIGSSSITRILSITRDVNLISGYNNGTVMPTTRSNTTLQTYNAFGRINSLTADGYISEGIWWNQDFLIQRPNIETEINEYYGIY